MVAPGKTLGVLLGFHDEDGLGNVPTISSEGWCDFGTPRGESMKEEPIRLGPREQQIADLLLQGCDNSEIAQQLKMARRTVKAHFNRLFMRFGIRSGIKRVKLATLLYRRQLFLEGNATGSGLPTQESSELSDSSPRDSKIGKSHKS
jgi:hypothetical protein